MKRVTCTDGGVLRLTQKAIKCGIVRRARRFKVPLFGLPVVPQGSRRSAVGSRQTNVDSGHEMMSECIKQMPLTS